MSSTTYLVAFSLLLLLHLLFPALAGHCPEEDDDGDKIYDFIVVGGGAAGATLASRLSENPDNCVLLLERGPPNLIPHLYAPGNAGFQPFYDFVSAHDPKYFTDYQFGLNGRQIYHAMYRGLGGRTCINGAVATRPSPSVLDSWPTGWKYADLLPYYKKSEDHYCYYDPENVTGISPQECLASHGIGGPMEINRAQPEYFANAPFTTLGDPDSFQMACEELGLGYNQDPSVNHTGCFPIPFYRSRFDEANPNSSALAMRSKRLNTSAVRESTDTRYLTLEVKSRPNLYIQTDATVYKINFKDQLENGKYVAKGVSYTKNHAKKKAKAKKEIVLAASTFDTPHLLQASGIGDAALLESQGIQVLINNTSVGRNFTDSLLLSYTYKTKVAWPGTNSTTADETMANNPFYFKFNDAMSYGAYIKTGLHPTFPNETDMLFFLIEGGFATRGSQVEIYPGILHPSVSNTPVVTFLVTLQFASARGSISLQTDDVDHHPPRISPNVLFLDSYEVAAMTKAVEIIESMVYNTSWGQRFFTGERLFPLPEVSVLEHIKDGAVTAYKQCCTCKINHVVDTQLKVIGTKKLRIADQSVFYDELDSSPSMTIIALAEKAAAMILADHA